MLADGPAVPEGREPAAVASEPSDEDIMEMMSEEMRADLAAAACAMAEQSGSDSPRIRGLHRIILNSHAVDLARAVLARWGTSDLTELRRSLEEPSERRVAPPPAEGEVVELVAALKVIDKMQQEWVLLGDDNGTASPSLTMPISLRRFTVIRDALTRAADLLEVLP